MKSLTPRENPSNLFHQPGTPAILHKLHGHQKNKRQREVGEAVSVSVCNSTTTQAYRTGQGEVWQPIRAGGMDAYRLPSRGIDAL